MRKIFSNLLLIYAYIKLSPWGGAIYDPRDFNCAKLYILVPRMINANLKYILAIGSEDFHIFFLYTLYTYM